MGIPKPLISVESNTNTVPLLSVLINVNLGLQTQKKHTLTRRNNINRVGLILLPEAHALSHIRPLKRFRGESRCRPVGTKKRGSTIMQQSMPRHTIR